MTDWSVYAFGPRDDTHFDGLHPLAAPVCLPVSSTALAAMEKHTLAEKSKKKIGGHMPSMSGNRKQHAPLVPSALNTPTSRGSMKRRAGEEISRDSKRRTLEGAGYSTDDNSTPRYCSDPKELMKGPWTSEEDKQLIDLVNTLGPKNWSQVASHLAKRNGKQCRERYFNHLDPEINKGEWSAEEDKILIDSQARLGNKWSLIAKSLPHRSENQVKNRWNSMMRSHWNRTQKKKGAAANKQDVKAELASRYSSYASTAPVVTASMRSHSVNLNSSSVLPLVQQPPVPAPIQVPVQVEPVASSLSLTTECIATSQMNETSVTIPRWIFDELIHRHLLSLPDHTKDRIVGVIRNMNLENTQYDGSYFDSDNSYDSSPVKEEEEDFYDDESAIMTDDSDTLLAPNAVFSRARSSMHLDPDMVNNSPTGDTPLESPLKRSSCFQFDNVLPTDSIGWYRPMPPMATDPLYDVEFERSYL